MKPVRVARCIAIVSLAFSLQGCAAVGLAIVGAGAGAGASAGVDHTLNGIVYKTFAVSLNETRFATLKTFDRMGMEVTADAKSDDGWALTATATDRTIDVELQSLTETTTRMRVVANQGKIFFKDASTATEIINQTAQALDEAARVKHSNANPIPSSQESTI